MVLHLTPYDLILEAVALDDVEWVDRRQELDAMPKEVLCGHLVAALTQILELEIRSADDIERTLTRLGDVAGALMQLPKNSPSIRSHLLRPHPAATPEQRNRIDRLMKDVLPRLMTAKRSGDEPTAKALAADIRETVAANLPQEATGTADDLEMVRVVFTSYAGAYKAWFDRDKWMGKKISKGLAYYLIDSVAGSSGKAARLKVVFPEMRKLAADIADEETREAVLISLKELEELDGVAGELPGP